MSELSVVLLATCGLGLLCVALIGFGAFMLVRYTGLGMDVLQNFGGLGALFGGEEDPVPSPGAGVRGNRRRKRHTFSAQQANPLDFDAALARHRKDNTPAVSQPDPPMPDTPGLQAEMFDTNASSPISGRVMRDGRYRRMTGGTPGREKDQDFRRVEGGGEPPAAGRPEVNIEPHIPRATSPLRRRRRDRNQDEIFGSKLDEDEDGLMDF